MQLIHYLSFMAIFLGSVFEASEWSYTGEEHGPDNWHKIEGYEQCAGQHQSPIDIDEDDAQHWAHLTDFHFKNYDVVEGVSLQISNNGHTAQVVPSGAKMTLTGGGFSTEYTLWQFHFHWGSKDSQGSEHTMNGRSYPMEVHFVHYKSKFDSPNAAIASGEKDALAVLGWFYEISDYDNQNYVDLLNDLQKVSNKSIASSVIGSTFKLNNLFQEALGPYYRYEGSLTTPPCSEIVQWTVFEKTIKISSRQMETFRELVDDNAGAIVDNYRRPQPMNGRTLGKYTGEPMTAKANQLSYKMMVFIVTGVMGALALIL